MSAPDNPPAFPQTQWSMWGGDGREGMTLRDWFAGQALIANGPINWHPSDRASAAQAAYAIADAMLAERERSA